MPPEYSLEESANTLPVFLMDKLKGVNVKGVTRTAIMGCLANELDKNRYNPVVDMLQGTEWDGKSRFAELVGTLGIDLNSFYGLLIKKWMLQCVAMAFNTFKVIRAADGVLVLQAEQRIGKTLFFRRLAIYPEWLSEGVTLDLNSKDDVLRATGAWITELGELDSTLKKEQAALKAFLTQRVDRIRAPYAHEAVDRPRHTSFCATVNPGQFLKDTTGDKRFFVVPVETVNLQKLTELPREWFIQVWAEMYEQWLKNPEGFRLSREELDTLDKSNQVYREALPGEEEIRSLFDFDLPFKQWNRFTPTELKKRYFYGERIIAAQIGRVLSKLEREDTRITHTTRANIKHYLLPIQSDFVPSQP